LIQVNNRLKIQIMNRLLLIITSIAAIKSLAAEEILPEFTLDPYQVITFRVANEEASTSYAQPLTLLRYEPKVDIMARGQAEGQGDVSIRGGIFENSGFKVGAVQLFDPQTGHYFGEIPVPTRMLLMPTVYTGYANVVEGFNSTAGTIAYGWSPIAPVGSLTVSRGNDRYVGAELYQGVVFGKGQWAVDVDFAGSRGDGRVTDDYHEFTRSAGRVQHRAKSHQTDLFLGYQEKQFGWPNLYVAQDVHAKYGLDDLESENLKTRLFILNHEQRYGDGSTVELGLSYRRHSDHYLFVDKSPNKAFVHETEVRSASIDGQHVLNREWKLCYSSLYLIDEITSTTLNKTFMDRDYTKQVVALEGFLDNEHQWAVKGGVAYEDSNRDSDQWSPIARLEWHVLPHKLMFYSEFARSSQLPGYTALNPGGLFSGNTVLGRESSDNIELGAVYVLSTNLTLSAAAFERQDDQLVDWTFTTAYSNGAARYAKPVDVDTRGLEILLNGKCDRLEWNLGYTFLDKTADYQDPTVQASFYALNYARHRFTFAGLWKVTEAWDLRMDNEYRVQEANPLRSGSSSVLLTSLGIHYRMMESLTFGVTVDNLWDADYEEVPAVPAAPRSYVFSCTMDW
jgi:outer membrane cobalamin receptor